MKIIGRNYNFLIVCEILLTCIYIFCSYFLPKTVNYSILVILLVLLSFKIQYRGKISLTKPQKKIIIVYLAWCAYLMMGTIWGIALHTTFSTSTLIVVTVLIGIASIKNETYIKLLPIGLFLFSLFEVTGVLLPLISPSTYFSILSKIPGDTYSDAIDFLSQGRSSGFTRQTAIAGYFVLISFSITFCGLLYARKKKQSGTLIILLLVIEILALLLTFKRGFIVAIFLSSIFTLLTNKLLSIKSLLKWGILFCLILLISFPIVNDIPEIQQSLERMEVKDDGTDMTSGRGRLASRAIDIFQDNPILGIGLGGYSVHSEMGTHNVYLQLLCETGIIGFSLFLTIILSNLFSVIRIIRKSNNFNFYYSLSLFIQVSYIIYALVGNPLTDNFIFIIYVICANISYSPYNKSNENCRYDLLPY